MAHLWTANGSGEWRVEPIEGGRVSLLARRQLAASSQDERDPIGRAPAIVSVALPTAEAWVLIGARHSRVRVNGDSVATGIRVLRDRDEIQVDGRRLYFSTETLARVVPFADDPPSRSSGEARARAVPCGRCRGPIAAAADAVKCPACGIWHHQSAELPCWRYADTCAACPQPTDLDAGFRWTPDGAEP